MTGADKPVRMYSAHELDALYYMVGDDLKNGPLLDRAVSLRMEIRNSILHTFNRFKKGDRE